MWAGLIAGLLILVGFALAGPAPAPAEGIDVIARHLAEHRDRILTGDLLIAAGAPLYLWFLAAARPVLGLAALAGGALGMTVVVACVALQAGLVLGEETLASEAVVRFGFDAYNALVTLAGVGFALAAGAAAAAPGLGSRLRAVAGAVAGLQVLTLPGLVAGDGPFAPAGPVAAIAFWALTAWSMAVAVHLLRRP
jgi:hypothetical protein